METSDIQPLSIIERNLDPSLMIEADTDRKAVSVWLADYKDTPNTFSSYKKEADRFLLWMSSKHLHLKDLTRENVLEYRHFLSHPGKQWVSTIKYSRDDFRWKPFSGPLSSSSIKQAEIILSHMYSWLTKAGYIRTNPFALTSRKIRTGNPIKSMLDSVIDRHINEDLWSIVISSIEAMPINNNKEKMIKERCKWIVLLLKSTGLRASEAVNAKFSQLRSSHIKKNNNTINFWMLDVIGKGGKSRSIPIYPELLSSAVNYCGSMGLEFNSVIKDSVGYPVIMPINGDKRKNLSRSALHLLIKQIFERAILFTDDEQQKDKLIKVSSHWLRHTAGSFMANNGTDVLVIKEILGHASLDTSSIYLHLEDDLALYEGAKVKK